MNKLEIGQKVFISTPDEMFFDSGRILDIAQAEKGEDTINQIAVRSDSLDGEGVIFCFFPEMGRWIHFFQDPLEDPGSLVFNQREPTYEIFGAED
jgi:hypothetical protein